MPSISFEKVALFLQTHEFKYGATQPRLSFPIINRIYYKMGLGIDFDNIKVCDSLIIDGHHRYISGQLLQRDCQADHWNRPTEISIYEWANVILDNEDWESKEEVKEHNRKDANNAGIDKATFDHLLDI